MLDVEETREAPASFTFEHVIQGWEVKHKRLRLRWVAKHERFTLVIGKKIIYDRMAERNGNIWVGDEMRTLPVGQKFQVVITESEHTVVMTPV